MPHKRARHTLRTNNVPLTKGFLHPSGLPQQSTISSRSAVPMTGVVDYSGRSPNQEAGERQQDRRKKSNGRYLVIGGAILMGLVLAGQYL